MYDLNKRSYVTTLGELRQLLADYPDDTRFYACGATDCYLHIEEDGSFVSIDYDGLDSDYDAELHVDDSDYDFWEVQYAHMMKEHEDRLAVLTKKYN